MKTIEKNRHYVEKLKQLLSDIYKKKYNDLFRLCAPGMIWKVNHVRGNGLQFVKLCEILTGRFLKHKLKNLVFHDIEVLVLTNSVVQISACYDVVCDIENSEENYIYEIAVTFQSEKVVYMQINGREIPVKMHRIRSTKEEHYWVREDEVLYIESNHNHLIWHWTHGIIVANDSLHHLENIMSDDFVRIQRSYLINKNHVRCVRRCEAVMRNADVLSIPSKKYMSVKKILENA